MMFRATLIAALASMSVLVSTAQPTVYQGDVTYFKPGLGACGVTNTESDLIVAVSANIFTQFGPQLSNGNPVCGRQVRITYEGRSVIATVQDKCPECATGSLDLSPAAFAQLADFGVGRLHNVTWVFL